MDQVKIGSFIKELRKEKGIGNGAFSIFCPISRKKSEKRIENEQKAQNIGKDVRPFESAVASHKMVFKRGPSMGVLPMEVWHIEQQRDEECGIEILDSQAFWICQKDK